jgi:hypothetical protein
MSVPIPPPAAAVNGIVYDADCHEDESEDDDDADLFVNTNRLAAIQPEDSSSSDEETNETIVVGDESFRGARCCPPA